MSHIVFEGTKEGSLQLCAAHSIGFDRSTTFNVTMQELLIIEDIYPSILPRDRSVSLSVKISDTSFVDEKLSCLFISQEEDVFFESVVLKEDSGITCSTPDPSRDGNGPFNASSILFVLAHTDVETVRVYERTMLLYSFPSKDSFSIEPTSIFEGSRHTILVSFEELPSKVMIQPMCMLKSEIVSTSLQSNSLVPSSNLSFVECLFSSAAVHLSEEDVNLLLSFDGGVYWEHVATLSVLPRPQGFSFSPSSLDMEKIVEGASLVIQSGRLVTEAAASSMSACCSFDAIMKRTEAYFDANSSTFRCSVPLMPSFVSSTPVSFSLNCQSFFSMHPASLSIERKPHIMSIVPSFGFYETTTVVQIHGSHFSSSFKCFFGEVNVEPLLVEG
jgi:hypothetical protein